MVLLPACASASEGIAAGPRRTIWFTEPTADRIGRVDASGRIEQFPIPSPESEPTEITSGPEGDMWFTEHRTNKIGRISPSGAIREFDIPLPSAKSEPERSRSGRVERPGPAGIAASLGSIWFTEGGSNAGVSSVYGGQIERMAPTGAVSIFEIPNPNSEPGSIVAGPHGDLWFTLQTLYGGRIGEIRPNGTITETVLPESHEPSDLAAGPDGAIWFTETVFGRRQITGNIGRLGPDGTLRTFRLTRPTDQPGAIAASKNALWFSEFSGPNTSDIANIAPDGKVREYRDANRALGVAVGPGQAVWFTAGGPYFGHSRATLGRLSPTSGAVREIPLHGTG